MSNTPSETPGHDKIYRILGAHDFNELSADPEELEAYKQKIRRRRMRVICVKLGANAIFIAACTCIVFIGDEYGWKPVSRVSFWAAFAVCALVALALPYFAFLGLLRKGPFVSQVWFEITWLLLVSGFDGFLLWVQIIFRPPVRSWRQHFFGDPLISVSVFLFALALLALAVDVALSLGRVCFLLASGWRNRGIDMRRLWPDEEPVPGFWPWFWTLPVEDFPWPDPQKSEEGKRGPPKPPRGIEFLFGRKRKIPPYQEIPRDLRDWIFNSTMFRRFSTFEPWPHVIIRGGVALFFWIVTVAYGILNTAVNPLLQFDSRGGLPTKSLTQDPLDTKTFGHVSGFIALDILPISRFPSFHDEGLPSEVCNAIRSGIQASYTSPSTGQAFACDVGCYGLAVGKKNQKLVQIEASWNCRSIWEVPGFRVSATGPDARPSVSVTWNSAAYPARPVLNAGLLSVVTTLKTPNYQVESGWDPYFPRDWRPGVTFNFTAGQNQRVDVGRRRVYASKAALLDLIGIPQSPNVIVTYPIREYLLQVDYIWINSIDPDVPPPRGFLLFLVSVATDSAPSSPGATLLTFVPEFGAYNDEIDEEYLPNTVLSGMSATGGLYATFDVVFILLFGRSLLAALFGSKHVTPFGVIASVIRTEAFNKNLKEEYPGIDGKDADPNKKARATCDFLHDFVLDLKPVRKVEGSTNKEKEPSKDGDQAKASETGDKRSPSAEKTAVLTYDRTHSTDGSV